MNGYVVNLSEQVVSTMNEGAPYTLSTPRISCSESPMEEERDEVTLPSLNNKRTLELVDKKRERHRADMSQEEEDEEEKQVVKVFLEDDQNKEDSDHLPSPTFTPENSSDDEDVDLDEDDQKKTLENSELDSESENPVPMSKKSTASSNIGGKSEGGRDSTGPLPSLNNASTIEKIRSKREKWKNYINLEDSGNLASTSEPQTIPKKEDISGNENPFTPTNSITEESTGTMKYEFDFESANNQWVDKVHEKRMKLETDNFEVTASDLVNDVIEKSVESIRAEEVAVERSIQLLKEWSKNYTEDELERIEQIIEKGDLKSIAELMTNTLLRDLSDPNYPLNECEDELHMRVALETDYNQCPVIEAAQSSARYSEAAPILYGVTGCTSVEDASLSLYRRFSSPTGSDHPESKSKLKEEERVLLNAAGESDLEEITEHLQNEEPSDNQIKDFSNNTEEINKNWNFSDIVQDCGTYQYTDEDSEATLPCQIIAIYNYKLPIKPIFTTGSPVKSSSSKLSENHHENGSGYNDMMISLFQYLINHLEQIENDNYILVYFHCYGNERKTPPLSWIHECYRNINYKLEKSLRKFYIVHPTIWLKGMILFHRLFMNSNFSKKIQYVSNLDHLKEILPHFQIPLDIQNLETK